MRSYEEVHTEAVFGLMIIIVRPPLLSFNFDIRSILKYIPASTYDMRKLFKKLLHKNQVTLRGIYLLLLKRNTLNYRQAIGLKDSRVIQSWIINTQILLPSAYGM